MGSGYRIEHLGQKDGSGLLNLRERHGSFLNLTCNISLSGMQQGLQNYGEMQLDYFYILLFFANIGDISIS